MRLALLLLPLLFVAALAPSGARAEACEPFEGAGTASAPDPGSPGGAALLVLPKNAAGRIPLDFRLAPGARISSSRFSPVICATIVRIEGPEGAAPADLVEVIPAEAIVVPDSVYRPGAVSVRALPGASRPAPAGGAAETARPGDSPRSTSAVAAAEEPPGEDRGDPYRELQYGLDRLGVDAAAAVTRGAGARIAVLDSAPATDHPDLPGFRTVSSDAGAKPAAGLHGTLVMGVVAAIPDNGIGIAGIAPEIEALAIPICEDSPEGETCPLYRVLEGIDLAYREKARVVNMAVAGPPNPVMGRAMQRLDDLGMAVVAAAGNDGSAEPRFPAAYPTVIGVGAVDRDGKLFERGNRGRSVEILAPGVEIVSTVPGGGFAFSDGTSLATAHVSAALSLLVAVAPDLPSARAALFQQAFLQPASSPSTAVLAPLCPALAQLGHPCPPAP